MVSQFSNKEEEAKGGSANYNTNKKADPTDVVDDVEEETKMIVTTSAAPKAGNGQLSTILNKHIKATPTPSGGIEEENDQSIRQSAANSLFINPQEKNALVPY